MRKAVEIQEAFADRAMLDGYKSFFLVGIGGAGMSALARMLKHRRFGVLGTDSTRSPETDRLVDEGIPVLIGHSGDPITNHHAVVLSDAIDLETSPEVARAKELGAPLFRRSQVLGWLLKDRKVIAVTGTHGKTTTTGMIGAGLKAAGMDPLIVVGANVPEFGGPVVEGKGEWAVVEACEAYDSFHDIDPTIVVLTNLELDHVDFHGSYENLKGSVRRFVSRANTLVYAEEDKGASEIAAIAGISQVPYRSDHFGNLLAFTEVLMASPKQRGRHNLLNAAAALVVADQVGADLTEAAKGITFFGGAERRQQVLLGAERQLSIGSQGINAPEGILEKALTVIDDYAHHPTEITESLKAIRGWYLTGNKADRLVVVFQPHLYSRTADLIPEFAAALSLADHVVLTDIYPAREDPIPGVSSARIAEQITVPCTYAPNRHLLPRVVASLLRKGDVVVGMGAGTISEFAPALIRELDQRPPFAINPRSEGKTTPTGSIVDDIARAGRQKKVAVIYGGDSAEREVSLLSGREVYAALKRKGYDASLVDVSEILIRTGDLSRFTGPDRPDLAFLAVHGTNAEDGAIQGLMELLHIPYTGSGIQPSAIAMDKQLTKKLLREQGIRVPEGTQVSNLDFGICNLEFTAGSDSDDLSGRNSKPQIPNSKFPPPPVVVKPNSQGSTVGLSFVERDEDVMPAIERALQYGRTALIEEWIVGMEISVPILGDRALPPVEIAPVGGRYDFASKYTAGATEEIVPARLPAPVLTEAQDIALKAHRTLGCVGATRTDMIVRRSSSPQTPSSVSGVSNRLPEAGHRGTEEGGSYEIFTLEVNTLPGMTATSLLPNSAKAAGIEFDDLVQWLVEDALTRYAAKA